ncbi:hypothetical protein, conserved [Leishmania tarentolae]|uniref:Intraflagellar transport protein 140 n=1 Tax=Leishmania tarentolae TaxID=5689 RepID=A0A640KQ11_LEITA|nr:Chain E, WD_REPEATS_REGION domain-containing protein [Leishmania tarentolae]8F5P_E Chain E, WD_REPEATS_REGION domain-containing protein [Leishmania tarentolae]GET91361.1 hypothetical protein, conserved [Leishmania tarentolae]
MSLFVVNAPGHEGQLKEQLIVAHKRRPLLATAWVNPPSVLITNSEGEVLTQVADPPGSTGRTHQPTALTWHPNEELLVIGWSNGEMSLWSMPSVSSLALGEDYTTAAARSAVQLIAAKAATQSSAEGATREHASGAVVASEWSTRGLYLVSASQQRHVVMWMLEKIPAETSVTFKLKPLWSVQSREPVARIIHVPSKASHPSTAFKLNNGATAAAAAEGGDDDISFLLADGGTSVTAINEDQQLFPCVTQQEQIASVLYDAATRTLVTLTTTSMIEVYAVGEDIKGTSTLRRKLSAPATTPTVSTTTGERIAMSMVWASPGVVAFGSGDDRLRILDLSSGSLDVLLLPQPDLHVSSLATFAAKGTMIVGTVEGFLVVFQHHAASLLTSRHVSVARETVTSSSPFAPAATEASQWEAMTVHQVGKCVDRVVLTALGDVALCCGGSELQVLHEIIRKRAWDGVAAATQISSDMVVIESITGCQCLLQNKGNVHGVSIAFPNIALWNGSQIDFYMIDEATSEITFINFVLTTSPAFAIHREGLIYVKGNRIVFETMQLAPIAQMTFTESEGVPVIMDIMNDYLVVVSSKNYLRLARISTRDLQQLGPARPLTFPSILQPDAVEASSGASEMTPFVEDISTLEVSVSGARVNAQGRRVALMSTLGPLALPDTRIWVYDSDTDKMSFFDFGSRNEIPNSVYWNTPEPNTTTVGEFEYILLACETYQIHMDDKKSASEEAESPKACTDTTNDGNKIADHPVGQENLPEALPDMENYAEKKAELEDARRESVGTTNYVSQRPHNIVTFFATHDGLVLQNFAPLRRYQICLVGLTIPDFLLASVKINGDPNNAEDYVIEQKRLRDFEGLKSDKDVAVREALMKFSYYATIGNMDEAYRCVKSIKNPAAWQGLARLCVTSGRLDVAAVCLATMEDCVAARALREAKEDYPDDQDVQLATLALGLSMTEEAVELLRKSKRYDLLTDVYMACGKFEHAQRHSERFDRARIRPVAYKYAQFMESLQNMDAAIMWYYNAKCASTDVPRIFFQTNRMHELRQLMMIQSQPPSPTAGDSAQRPQPGIGEQQSTFATIFPQNRELLLWWAQHSERRHNVQEALRFYNAGEDVYNIVRILCSLTPPKLDSALQLVNKEMDKAKMRFQQQQAFAATASARFGDDDHGEPDPVGSAYFVAQLYERQGDDQLALQYYQAAGAYRSGVRVAWKMEQYGVVANLAMKSSDERLMLETAMALEKHQAYDKAVQLYRRIGAVQCALDACVQGGLYETLHEVSAAFASGSTDPAVFLGMADHFQSESDYQKAVEMLLFAKHFEEALKLCETQNATLTEEMAESMTSNIGELSMEERQAVLRRVAHIAKDQGRWSLACKKYTQAGDRVKAMRMLMRGGETEKVIFFANHSRNVEIYTMAANFLQSQNWSADANIYKSIVLFYTKAKAWMNLLAFYESCAQLHIDENRNYPEALRALEDCIAMAESVRGGKANIEMEKVEQLKQRVEILKAFVKAQKTVDSMVVAERGSVAEKAKADSVIACCSGLIKRSRPSSPDHSLIQDALRIGDVFALMVRFYFDKLGEPHNALKVMESMPKHGADPQLFIEADYMERVCQANGKSLANVLPGGIATEAPGAVWEGARKFSTDTRRSSVIDEVDRVV